MQKVIFTVTLIVFSMLYSCSAFKSTSVQIPEIESNINAKDFVINVHTAQAKRMGEFRLSTDYSFKMHGDSASAYLPFYGNAYIAPIDVNEAAVNFSNILIDFTKKRNKNNDGWEMKFSVKSNIKLYQVFLKVYDNGRSYITISSYDRDTITYIGELLVNE